MERQIKFRVWNGEQMVSPDYIDRNGTAFWSENSIPCSTNKLMQFTGLYDKNGEEIYEGDILYVAGSGKGTVSYDKERACFGVLVKEYMHDFCDDGEGDIAFNVLGNIHSNPELL